MIINPIIAEVNVIKGPGIPVAPKCTKASQFKAIYARQQKNTGI